MTKNVVSITVPVIGSSPSNTCRHTIYMWTLIEKPSKAGVMPSCLTLCVTVNGKSEGFPSSMTVRRRYKETKSFYKIKRLVSCENTYWIGKYTANFFFFSKKLGINWCMLLNYANVLEHTDNKQSMGLDIKEQIVDNVLVEYLHWQPISFVLIFFHSVVLRIIWSREAISDLVSRNFDAWNAVWKLFCPLPAVVSKALLLHWIWKLIFEIPFPERKCVW